MAPSLGDLVAPGRCALLLQEVQKGVLGPESPLAELAAAAATVGIVDRLRDLTASARSAGVPVLHCTAAHMADGFGANHNARLFAVAARSGGTLQEARGDKVQPVDGLLGEGDLVIPRFHGLSPLTGSQLDALLRNEGISTLVITGVSLNVAIPNLVFDAVNRSYQVVVPTDAVAGVPVEYGRQVVENTVRLLATLTTVADLVETWNSRRAG
jgi:nicotinamidase-related amidase